MSDYIDALERSRLLLVTMSCAYVGLEAEFTALMDGALSLEFRIADERRAENIRKHRDEFLAQLGKASRDLSVPDS